jgi:sec-independent protein translocase protein TatC
METEQQSLQYHIQELRKRVIHSGIVFIVLSAIGIYFSGDILSIIQNDLGYSLNALSAYEAFYTQIMIGVLFGFFFSLPTTLYHMIKFAEPGLKPGEYRILRNYLPFSVILFVVGAVFAYTVIVKTSLEFFRASTLAADVGAVWSLQNTVGFSLKLSALTGIMFQLPIAALVLAKAGLINADVMRRYRAYFVVAVLLLAAIATPPDLVTQLLVTGPVIGLYQISIYLVKHVDPI